MYILCAAIHSFMYMYTIELDRERYMYMYIDKICASCLFHILNAATAMSRRTALLNVKQETTQQQQELIESQSKGCSMRTKNLKFTNALQRFQAYTWK